MTAAFIQQLARHVAYGVVVDTRKPKAARHA
jgi:hypothetical protein